jgi:transglutaminase-like putative cysteine protease
MGLPGYQSRVGDCTEFTSLIIALCRLLGIPAKFVSAIGYSEKGRISTPWGTPLLSSIYPIWSGFRRCYLVCSSGEA